MPSIKSSVSLALKSVDAAFYFFFFLYLSSLVFQESPIKKKCLEIMPSNDRCTTDQLSEGKCLGPSGHSE